MKIKLINLFLKRTFCESLPYKTGDKIVETFTITQNHVDLFSTLVYDNNVIHKDCPSVVEPYVNGALLNGFVSGLIGTKLPGSGTIVLSQTFSFPNKCVVNKQIETTIELADVRRIIRVVYECRQLNRIVFKGEARLIVKKTF